MCVLCELNSGSLVNMYTVLYCRYVEGKRIRGCPYILLLLPLLRWLSPCLGAYGAAGALIPGRAGEVHLAHLPHCTPPLPAAAFTSPSTSCPILVAVRVLGFFMFRGELSVKMLLLGFSVGWGGSHTHHPVAAKPITASSRLQNSYCSGQSRVCPRLKPLV